MTTTPDHDDQITYRPLPATDHAAFYTAAEWNDTTPSPGYAAAIVVGAVLGAVLVFIGAAIATWIV